MKGFVRNDPYFSLCGLNCQLCPMNLGGYCSGCGVDNQSCKIARCSLSRENVEYCFQCGSFPCKAYDGVGDYDSFITHQHQLRDMEKARRVRILTYREEQEKKRKLLDYLLANFNDGRRKSLFCVAVNLLEIEDLEAALRQVEALEDFPAMDQKVRARAMEGQLREIAAQRGILLRLRKKQPSGEKP